MSDYTYFFSDIDLWEPSTQVVWGSHFQVREIILSELYAISQAGTWGDIQKPKHNMAFLLIVLDRTVKGEKVFSLVAVWTDPHQAHHHSLGEAACKLALVINISTNWAYAFAWLNEGMLHTPLSSDGHISAVIDGVPSMNACGHLSQIEVHKLLQCRDQVVCPKGLNGELEPMQFTFSELPVWNADVLGEPAHKPLLLQVNLSSMKLRDEMPIAPVPPVSSTPPSSMHPAVKHPCKTATSMTAELQELLSWITLDASDLAPGHTTPRRSLSVSLGSQSPSEEEGSWWSESTDSTTPAPAVTLMPGNDPCISTINPTLPISHAPKTIQVVSVSPIHQPTTSLWPKLAEL